MDRRHGGGLVNKENLFTCSETLNPPGSVYLAPVVGIFTFIIFIIIIIIVQMNSCLPKQLFTQ